MRYLSISEVFELHDRIISSSGGSGGIRDIRALESAISQLRQTFDQKDLYPSIVTKAAALCFFLVMNHPFVDGNKRVGHAAMETFLILNGYEEIEEANAKPENQNQKDLVAYFDGEKEFSDRILEIFLEERNAENPNLPLIRKYFKKANPNLKSLILYGLDHYPGRLDLLSDLGYFHEFGNILDILITYCTRACLDQENLETFSELAHDFYYATKPDGYEALYALRDLFDPGSDKREIIDLLIAEEEGEKKDIPSTDPGASLH